MNKPESIAHNAKINATADDACRAYYIANPEGNWEKACEIAAAIRADLVSIPSGGFAVYPGNPSRMAFTPKTCATCRKRHHCEGEGEDCTGWGR